MFYSPSTGGFYIEEIHGDKIPLDSISITTSEWEDLINGQSNGKEIKPDAEGRPVLVTPQSSSLQKEAGSQPLNFAALIQEQQALITTLTARVAALEGTQS